MARISLSASGSYGSGAPNNNTDGIGNRGPNPYHPTVAMLLGLILFELAFIYLLRFGFRHTHGG